MRHEIALATCRELPAGDPDDAELPAALAEEGVGARWVAWDDAAVDWRAFDAVLVRSTWDYQRRRDEFVRWATALPAAINPAAVLAWNTDKRYLGELAAAGLPVVPTAVVEPGDALVAPADAFVVKPVVSAGSKDTARFAPGETESAEELLAAIHASGRAALVQPYLHSVDARGETALLFFDGTFSHAARKGPLLTAGAALPEGLFAAEDITPRVPDDDELAVGARVVEHAARRFGTLAYARVDLVAGPDGDPLLLELELCEPSLFFATERRAPARLARAVRRRLG